MTNTMAKKNWMRNLFTGTINFGPRNYSPLQREIDRPRHHGDHGNDKPLLPLIVQRWSNGQHQLTLSRYVVSSDAEVPSIRVNIVFALKTSIKIYSNTVKKYYRFFSAPSIQFVTLLKMVSDKNAMEMNAEEEFIF